MSMMTAGSPPTCPTCGASNAIGYCQSCDVPGPGGFSNRWANKYPRGIQVDESAKEQAAELVCIIEQAAEQFGDGMDLEFVLSLAAERIRRIGAPEAWKRGYETASLSMDRLRDEKWELEARIDELERQLEAAREHSNTP